MTSMEQPNTAVAEHCCFSPPSCRCDPFTVERSATGRLMRPCSETSSSNAVLRSVSFALKKFILQVKHAFARGCLLLANRTETFWPRGRVQTDGVTHPRLDCMHLSSNTGNRCSPRAWREGFGNSQEHHSAANPPAVSGCVAPLHAPSMSCFLLCLSLQRYMRSTPSWVRCQAPLLLTCFQGNPTVFA